MPVAREMDLIAQSCFVMGIPGSERHIFGNKNESHRIEEKGKRLPATMLAR